MSRAKEIFKKYQAQTFPFPSCLEIASAKGSYIYDVNGKPYLDFVAGVSANTLGHSNPIITDAVKEQLDKYTHVMVYGEYIQSPQYKLAKLLADNLPENLNTTYFVNSGAEAIEGAMKLAKRATGRPEIISCKDSYHGSTQGALSIMGNEEHKAKYRPLLPLCNQIIYNDESSLVNITEKTAAVVIEPVQGGTGFVTPSNNFLQKVRERCNKTGTLLIFDEIQTCFGRLGTLFGFEKYSVIPDILCIAKGMGAGMPIGAFISSWELMNLLTFEPKLGHITTFGGHPV
ncbi:MAG: aspartate aminotransferase family protein, partial [Flavobacteriales bacterium]|nr:aspartate aminotransferase family protein [Flavobacteriales bacterium]